MSSPRPEPRSLPEYDNALLSHANRTRIASRDDVTRVFTKRGLLVDGFLAGRWDVKRERRLLGFLAPEVESRAVVLG